MAIIGGNKYFEGSVSFVDIEYDDLLTLRNNSNLSKGTYYKITNRGDRGILIQAIDINKLNSNGIRFMLCPKYYDTGSFDGDNWIGIWNSALTPSINDITIWGGGVWQNVTGAVGNSISDVTLDSNWEIILKDSVLANTYYTEIQFNIVYDFDNDWIESQKDNFGNTCGTSYEIYNTGYVDYNTTDITDWNTNSSAHIVMNYSGAGFWNNTNISLIVNCNVAFGIKNNHNIYNIDNIDNISSIAYNRNVSAISQCYNISNIYGNVNINGGIYYCSNITGGISNNNNVLKIEKNIDCVSIGNCNNIPYGVYNNNGITYGIGFSNLDSISNHSSKYFSTTIDFNATPLIVGTPQFPNFFGNGVISEIVALGELDVIGNIGALISIGIDIDDPNYITPTPLSDYIDGVKLAILSNRTTATRRMKIEATVADVTVGYLTIVVRHS